jgi:Glycosyl hydrolase family 85
MGLTMHTGWQNSLHQQHRKTLMVAAAGAVGTIALLLAVRRRRWWARCTPARDDADDIKASDQIHCDESEAGATAARAVPLRSVCALLSWVPPTHGSGAPAARACAPLRCAPAASGRQQLIVCHDMCGGYLPCDSLLAGVTGSGHYRLWHWDSIDVFIYFSHHLVTIPPPGWTHAAHVHGVKV